MTGDGAAVFAAADRMGLEGIVSKRTGSRYRSGRSTIWLKTKCMTEGDFVVIGTERNEGGPPFALLARQDEVGLSYAGSAFVTLPAPARDLFWMLAGELAAAKPAIPGLKSRKATWCRAEPNHNATPISEPWRTMPPPRRRRTLAGEETFMVRLQAVTPGPKLTAAR